jgi:hypothetical protein
MHPQAQTDVADEMEVTKEALKSKKSSKSSKSASSVPEMDEHDGFQLGILTIDVLRCAAAPEFKLHPTVVEAQLAYHSSDVEASKNLDFLKKLLANRKMLSSSLVSMEVLPGELVVVTKEDVEREIKRISEEEGDEWDVEIAAAGADASVNKALPAAPLMKAGSYHRLRLRIEVVAPRASGVPIPFLNEVVRHIKPELVKQIEEADRPILPSLIKCVTITGKCVL